MERLEEITTQKEVNLVTVKKIMHSLFDIYEYPDIEELKTIKSLIQNLEWSDGARSNPNNPVKVNKQAYDQALSAQIHQGIYKIGSSKQSHS